MPHVIATHLEAPTSGRGLLQQLTGPLPGRQPLPRMLDIDAVRGIAIVLVVVGHVVSREMPTGNLWYAVLKALIYKFHMPLFMTLAGMSFALSLPLFPGWSSIVPFSRQKVVRLFLAYLFFGLLILLGKTVAARFLHVDNPPSGGWADIVALVTRPSESVAGFLWFIYVLALYFIAVPPFLQATGRRPILLFLLALPLAFVDWPSEFLLKEFFEYLPFFAGGMLLWMCRDSWSRLSLGAVLASSLVFFFVLAISLNADIPKWVVGMLSIPAWFGIVQRLPERWQRAIARVGQLSLAIYLMNTLAIGIVKAILLKFMPWDGINFLVYFPLLTMAGIAIPIAVKGIVARTLPTANRYL